jgi:hypothetical protein
MYCVSVVVAKLNKDRDDASIESKDLSFSPIINIVNISAHDESLTPFCSIFLFCLHDFL